jgi:hypothetical protein
LRFDYNSSDAFELHGVYREQNYKIFTRGLNENKFFDNSTFTMKIPFGARGCKAIKNA